jgi:hypothetical protein
LDILHSNGLQKITGFEDSAEPFASHSNLWVLSGYRPVKPDSLVLQVEGYRNPILACEDSNLAAGFGLGIAEIWSITVYRHIISSSK